jgi:hypothetical protein
MRSVRLLKLARVIRAYELMSHLKYLHVFLVCIMGSLSSFLWSVIMLLSVCGIFSLFFMQIIASHLEESRETVHESIFGQHFNSFGVSVRTLFMITTGGEDWNVPYELIKVTGPFGSGLFLVFIAFVNLNILNIIMGIFVDSAMKVLSADPDMLAREHIRQEHEHAQRLASLCREVDPDCSGKLTQDQFEDGLRRQHIPKLLSMLGLQKHHILEFFDSLAKSSDDGGQVDIGTFVNGCMLLKGASTNFDLHKMHADIQVAHKTMIQMLSEITVPGGRAGGR